MRESGDSSIDNSFCVFAFFATLIVAVAVCSVEVVFVGQANQNFGNKTSRIPNYLFDVTRSSLSNGVQQSRTGIRLRHQKFKRAMKQMRRKQLAAECHQLSHEHRRGQTAATSTNRSTTTKTTIKTKRITITHTQRTHRHTNTRETQHNTYEKQYCLWFCFRKKERWVWDACGLEIVYLRACVRCVPVVCDCNKRAWFA